MRWPCWIGLVLFSFSTAMGQQFELVEPNGLVAATAFAERGRLTVFERATGERLFFGRETRYDTRDGRFVAYFNVPLNRILRFPRSGVGKMQVADLDHLNPQFEFTRRSVRPVTVAPVPPVTVNRFQSTPPVTFGTGGAIGGYHPVTPYPQRFTPGFPYQPQSILLDSEVVPNPPLPPARVRLFNGGPREIQVGVVDLKVPNQTRTVRIAPRQSREVELRRDSGATRIDHYSAISPYGDTVTKRTSRPIPPVVRYEIVVHEWNLQSIAIDRTGKSPQAIEDVNYQGKGLGRFPVPPGDRLASGTIDVYRGALQSGNQGTVAPIVTREDPPTATSPLEKAILEAQRRAQQR